MKLLFVQIIVLWCICIFTTNAQDITELDSLNALSKSLACKEILKSDSISKRVLDMASRKSLQKQKGYALKNLGSNRMCSSEYIKAIDFFKRAIRILNKANEGAGVAATLNNLAMTYYRQGQLDSAILTRKKQVEKAIQIGHKMILSVAYNGMASVYLKRSETDSAIHYSLLSLEIAKQIQNKTAMAIALTNAGSAHFRNKNYDKALEYYRLAEPTLTEIKDNRSLFTVKYNMAGMFSTMNLMDSSFVYFDQAKKLAEVLNNKYMLGFCYGGLGDAYFKVDNFPKSVEYQLLAKTINEELGAKGNLASNLNNLSSSYFQLGKHSLAIDYAHRAIDLANQNGYLKEESEGYLYLSKGLRNSNLKGSIEALEMHYELERKYLNEEKSRQITELQTKYETAEKDLEIKDLSQRTQIQELEINQRNFLLIGFVALFLVFMLIAVLLIRQSTIRRKQAVAEMEQKLLRLQMNPHFIFNAMGAIQNFMLKNDTKNAGVYLAKFSKLMRQTLEFSREEFISLQEEKELLENYIEIQKLCTDKKFDYSIEVSEELDREEVKLPPMFAQPFIENAIEHGKLDNFDDGKLEVLFSLINGQLHLTIKDNGVGVEEKLEFKGHKSLATSITMERLKILEQKFKTRLEFAIGNNTDQDQRKGTRVQLALPLLS